MSTEHASHPDPGLPAVARRLLRRTFAALLAVLLTLAVLEAAFRVAGHDFSHGAAAFEAVPIYYRQPTVPAGDVYFRRPGPATWTGKVLSIGYGNLRGLEAAYAGERDVRIEYDAAGFRNPPGLADWEVVVVGDSFLEAGYLEHPDLITTRLGDTLGLRVRNLGVSFCGPRAYLHHLAAAGVAPSTRHAVMAFAEGNDVADLLREDAQLREFRESGVRELREVDAAERRQSSLVRALLDAFDRPPRPHAVPNAYFAATDGEVGVDVVYAPPGAADLPAGAEAALRAAVADWGTAARDRGMEPWLLYVPCKRRVLERRLRFTPRTPRAVAEWRPSDLPDVVRRLCGENGVRFVDPTADLVAETTAGRLTFNHVFDTHLNALGCEVIARVLAGAMR